MTSKPARTVSFHASIIWRGDRFGEIFVGKDKKSRGLVNPPPVFGGLEGTWNPEDMLVASLSQCTMATFLHFVNANNIELISYENNVIATLTKGKDGFSFTHFHIEADVMVEKGFREKAEEALKLSERFCLISNSLKAEKEHTYNLVEVGD